MKGTISGFLALAILTGGAAQADIADQKIPVTSSPELVFQQMEQAAIRMCAVAARTDRVVDEAQCVNTLIAYALAEADRPMLTSVALAQRPAIASIKVHLPADVQTKAPRVQSASVSP